MNKKLYRSTKDKVLAGVCGGLGEYFDVDPTLVRLACGLLCLYAGTGLLAYVVAACIIPVDPRQFQNKKYAILSHDFVDIDIVISYN